jgi:hypothetical protein
LTAGLHASLLHLSTIRDALFFFLRESASTDEIERVMGTWCMAAHDADRQLSAFALKSWDDSISLQDVGGKLFLDLVPLLSFVQRVLLDPKGVYTYLNPIPPVIIDPPRISGRSALVTSSMKREEAERHKDESNDEESESDRKARLRIGAFGALKWILGLYRCIFIHIAPDLLIRLRNHRDAN